MIDYSSLPPVIPTRTSVRTADRRRRSLPASSVNTPARRSANHVSVKPASPEVICSLISTLSAISPPVDREFGYLATASFSRSTPSSPLPYQAEFPLITRPSGYVYKPDPVSPTKIGFGMEYNAYATTNELTESTNLHPNYAIGPTIIRHSPEHISSSNTPQSFSSRSNVGRGYDFEETSSMGSLSIEPRPRFSGVSTGSSESSCQKSTRSFKSLKIGSSVAGLNDENKRSSKNDAATYSKANYNLESCEAEADGMHSHSPALLTPLDSGKPIIKDSSLEAFQEISWSSSTHNRLSRATNSTLGEPNVSPCITDSPRTIPNRESSLRHSYGGSSSHRKRKSYRSDPTGNQEIRKFSFEYSRDSHSQASQKAIENAVEDEVSRRIKELKYQKRLRDRPLTIATSDLIMAAGSPRNSRSPSPLPTNRNLPKEQSGNIQGPQNLDAGEESKVEASESSAPSPSILQRINRSSSLRVSSVASKTISIKQSQLKNSSEYERADTFLPKRSNSRLLRRLSRPTSPTNAEKHKRTFSNSLIDERPKSTDYVDEAVNDYISSARLSQKIKNPQTGRVVSFSEVGDPNGSAVFCCVGMGLTRYITAFYDELASTLKLRLITPDRPGVGASEAHLDGLDTPLGWPDDVLSICQHLKLSKFSILAHSAGAIYALATALRMPQHIRGRIHILAPWIPPSQMAAIGSQQEALPVSALPYSQRFLRSLPTPFLRAANSSFLSTTSASITTRLPKSTRRTKRKSLNIESSGASTRRSLDPTSSPKFLESGSNEASISKEAVLSGGASAGRRKADSLSLRMAEKERQSSYDTRLMEAIWTFATTDANPAVDLLVCLERRQPIGFRYVDITRAVVIHHGSKDTRVPVENVKWLGKTMRRCEVRVLEGEGHGLMASAGVMGGVLVEMAKEWEDWMRLVQGKGNTEKNAVR